MSRKISLACQPGIESLSVASILPLKHLSPTIRKSPKYQCIAASIREIGIIEPLVVYPQQGQRGVYMLLDGHIRFQIVRDAGAQTVECLVATDDEAFTYNHKVNRLSAIQEHFMITRAIKKGASEQRIATSLNVDVASIRKKRDLLEGICPEAVELLKTKKIGGGAIREMRKVKPLRQIEMAELMIASWNFSVAYAKCLLAATPQAQLVDDEQKKEIRGLSAEDIARIEHEMEGLERDFKTIEESHGKNVLNLVIVVGYLKKLLDNARVLRFLSRNHPEILTEFQKLVEARNLAEDSPDQTHGNG
ncbi:plasmid partitioning protein RepB C-terminal domain-containing protein [Planctomicrobium sp. SH661]|uniref:plasmid partitioning protein RepB C-terminal domain-containing protein n=1 Tax=Planctomicrobium sp. SH661 TaxID=3448124 RepID=UPI003F5C93C1